MALQLVADCPQFRTWLLHYSSSRTGDPIDALNIMLLVTGHYQVYQVLCRDVPGKSRAHRVENPLVANLFSLVMLIMLYSHPVNLIEAPCESRSGDLRDLN